MDESSSFSKSDYIQRKGTKKSKKALVEDVEFRNIPKVDGNKKGLLDSLLISLKERIKLNLKERNLMIEEEGLDQIENQGRIVIPIKITEVIKSLVLVRRFQRV